MDVAHPVEVNLLVVFGNDGDLALLHCLGRALRQRRDLDEPLRRKPRLNYGSAAVAFADGERVILFRHQESLFAQVFEHTLTRCKAIQPRIRPRILVHAGVVVHDVDLRQVVPQPGLKVVGIVSRRDFNRAGTELRIGQLVRDDRNLPIHQWQQDFLPVQMFVALVPGIDGDSGVSQHGLGTRGGHNDELLASGFTSHYRVAYLVNLSRRLLVLYFEIRDRGHAARTPVHDVLAAIDQALFIQAHKDFAHRDVEPLFHGEVFARPIHRVAQALHLL